MDLTCFKPHHSSGRLSPALFVGSNTWQTYPVSSDISHKNPVILYWFLLFFCTTGREKKSSAQLRICTAGVWQGFNVLLKDTQAKQILCNKMEALKPACPQEWIANLELYFNWEKVVKVNYESLILSHIISHSCSRNWFVIKCEFLGLPTCFHFVNLYSLQQSPDSKYQLVAFSTLDSGTSKMNRFRKTINGFKHESKQSVCQVSTYLTYTYISVYFLCNNSKYFLLLSSDLVGRNIALHMFSIALQWSLKKDQN